VTASTLSKSRADDLERSLAVCAGQTKLEGDPPTRFDHNFWQPKLQQVYVHQDADFLASFSACVRSLPSFSFSLRSE